MLAFNDIQLFQRFVVRRRDSEIVHDTCRKSIPVFRHWAWARIYELKINELKKHLANSSIEYICTQASSYRVGLMFCVSPRSRRCFLINYYLLSCQHTYLLGSTRVCFKWLCYLVTIFLRRGFLYAKKIRHRIYPISDGTWDK